VAITLETMILDVVDNHPKSIEVFRKYGLGQIEDPGIRSMAAGASLQTAIGFVGLSADQSEAMLKELNEAAGT
jgi:hypothetical protein